MRNYAIILASGTGVRFELSTPKQFTKIAGKTVLEHTLMVFDNHTRIDEIIVVSNREYLDYVQKLITDKNFKKNIKVVIGGETRMDSSFNGLNAIEDENAKVLIHDAVRPFLDNRIIDDCLFALDKYKAIDVAIPSADTIINVDEKNIIQNIPKRKFYRRGQTPQAFDLKTIKMAHNLARKEENISVTDDCSLVLKYNLAEVYVVRGEEENIKITYPIDIEIADKLFQLKTSSDFKNDFSKLKDKVVVVFGGNSGIGEKIVELLKQNNAIVYPFSRKNNVDITKIDEVQSIIKKVYEKTNRIDYVINTAGMLKYSKLMDRHINDIKKEIDVNYISNINIAKSSYEYLKKSKGMLVLFSSSSYTRGRKFYSIYSSVKSAIVNFTQALADEWEEDNIKVNVIVPERTATKMRFDNFGIEPMKSLLTPEYVANRTLSAMLSDLSGQVFAVHNQNKMV